MDSRPHTPPPLTWRWWAGLLALLGLFAALSLYQLALPGLHYDEAFEAVPALQLLLRQPVTAFRDSGLLIAGQTFPLMTQDYIGALNTYAALPFIAVLGTTPAALRLMSVLTGGLTLALAALLARRLSGQGWVGLLAALLLAVDPTFVFWNRQGVFVTAVTAAIGLGATYCWLRRWQSGRLRWSLAGAFLLGLGLYAKFLFLWLIAALVGAVLLLNLGELFAQRARWTALVKAVFAPEGLLAGLAFLAGCWPLLLYNLQTGGTWLSIQQNAATSYYGVDNLALGSNLLQRGHQFLTLLDGGHLWYLGDIITNPGAPLLFVLLAALTAGLSLQPAWRKSQPTLAFAPYKIALFPHLVIGLVVLASIGTVSALWITHYAILMPWPALAMALSSWFILGNLRGQTKRIGTGLLGLGLGLLVVVNSWSVVRYHQALTTSGGLSTHSDAVYDLSDWLETHATGTVVAMDWGLAAPVIYLTQGQVKAVEVFGYQWQPDVQLAGRLQSFIGQPDTLYLWRAPEEIIFDRSESFKALYRPRNLEETIEEAFYERSGRPVLGVTRLVEKGMAANPPQ